MRRKCHGVVRYLKSLVPVPQLDCSAEELFGCNGTENFDKVWALEILNTHMRALETRLDVAEEIDLVCPSWLAEHFIGQLLPQAIPRCVLGGVTDLHSPMKACAWFEDMEIYSLVMAREIEPHMQDLPEAWRFNESLNQDILRTYFHFTEEFERLQLESSTKLQVQHVIEPGLYTISVAGDEQCWKGSSILKMLADKDFNLKEEKSMHESSIKAFELQAADQNLLLEHYSGPSMHFRELEEYAKTIDIQNRVGIVGESDIEEPTKLFDFDPEAFLLDKLRIKPMIEQHELQCPSLPSYVLGCLSLLDEKSVVADLKSVTKHSGMDTVNVVFELPEILADEYLSTLLSLNLETYITSLLKPYPIELEMDSQETTFPDFEKLLILPELTLEPSRFHFLPVPSFIPKYQARLSEDVFTVLFRAKALPTPTSANLYLDWHLSQMGHCNNYGCFHLQRRLIENELHVTFPRDVIPGERMSDLQLLLCLNEDCKPWRHADMESGHDTEDIPAADLHASVSTSVPNFSSFLYSAAKAVDSNHSDESVLTEEPRNDFISARVDQVALVGYGPTPMDSVLSLMKQARQGVLSRDTKLMQVPENGFQLEGHQGICNTKDQSHETLLNYDQVLESTSTVKIPVSNPLCPSGIDAASSYDLHISNHVEPEIPIPLDTRACPSKGLPQVWLKLTPPLQPAHGELEPQKSEVEDSIQLLSEHGPHLIVVANILQPNKSILLQRRTSYQKILGLENEDLQVVERELKLPVDLILNPSTCMTIYTEEKLRCSRNRSSNPEEFLSYVMDIIVNCHMKALSFSFQRWFMIFEGDLAFNSAILRIMNKLYICSAGFEMHVQGFISTNPIVTDSLVLKCIKRLWKMSKRPFDSPMPEDLTDGELFLSNFPSLNPLSSHAILCLNVPMSTFFSWSQEEQHSALQDFNVRADSLALLRTLCIYGKLETANHRGLFSACPWPAASEIVAPEVECHAQGTYTYFPPASEIVNCEVDEDSHDVPTREGYNDRYSLSHQDPVLKLRSAEQGTLSWKGEWWPTDTGDPFIYSHHAHTGLAQRPTCFQENSDCCNPVDVNDILQQFVQRRKGGVNYSNYSEKETEVFCDSLKVPYKKSSLTDLHLNRLPKSGEAAYPTAIDKLQWAPLLQSLGKRPFSALEQSRHQRGDSPALQSQNKKSKPNDSTNRSRGNMPSSQLDHSLKISRNSCYKFNSPFGRSV